MSAVYVLDTSVAVAWYLHESFSGAAREWQRRLLTGDVRLIVPTLHYLEFSNVLRTYVRRGELREELALETYDLHLDAPLEVKNPEPRNILRTAMDYQSTTYDATYLQLSEELDIPLITAERSTTPWVTRLGDRAEVVR